MIFVTVGTHEQPFDRLLMCVDQLKEKEKIQESVFIQTGFSTYEPRHCSWQRLLPYQEMLQHIKQARIVITHGGPASFIIPLQKGKIPIVVPRQHAFGEHVNDHQVAFVQAMASRMGTIIPIIDIAMLQETIQNYDTIISSMDVETGNNNGRFNQEFGKVVQELF